jgi:hypothetical protein
VSQPRKPPSTGFTVAHASIFIPMFNVPVHPRNNNKTVSYKTYPIDKYSDMQVPVL